MSETWINNKCREWGLTMRKTTNAAAKLPEDWRQLCDNLAMRTAVLVHRHNIPEVRCFRRRLLFAK
jgi:hypothetical protein